MRPMLDPERDLAGATPEELARALLQSTSRKDHVQAARALAQQPAVVSVGPKSSMKCDSEILATLAKQPAFRRLDPR